MKNSFFFNVGRILVAGLMGGNFLGTVMAVVGPAFYFQTNIALAVGAVLGFAAVTYPLVEADGRVGKPSVGKLALGVICFLTAAAVGYALPTYLLLPNSLAMSVGAAGAANFLEGGILTALISVMFYGHG